MNGHWSDRLRALDACEDGIEWACGYSDPQSAWNQCKRPDWMLWLLGRCAEAEDIVEIACRIAESVGHLVPAEEDRPRQAIAAARAWIADPCDRTALAALAASDAASDAAGDAARNAARHAALAARHAALAASDAASDATSDAASDAALDASDSASYAALAVNDAALAARCDIIRTVVPHMSEIGVAA